MPTSPLRWCFCLAISSLKSFSTQFRCLLQYSDNFTQQRHQKMRNVQHYTLSLFVICPLWQSNHWNEFEDTASSLDIYTSFVWGIHLFLLGVPRSTIVRLPWRKPFWCRSPREETETSPNGTLIQLKLGQEMIRVPKLEKMRLPKHPENLKVVVMKTGKSRKLHEL